MTKRFDIPRAYGSYEELLIDPDIEAPRVESNGSFYVQAPSPVVKGKRVGGGSLMPDNQQVEIFGTDGRIEFEIPFNPVADKPSKIWFCHGDQKEEIVFDSCDQYTIQGDLFSLAILNDTPVPTPLQDAVDNMIVIERLFNDD